MKPVLICMGVSGCGKSTVGALLAENTGSVFIEGDDFHSSANIAKMKAGKALTDGDRKEWLRALAQEIEKADERLHIISCSALKESYRECLRSGNPERVRFLLLNGSREILQSRIEARRDHYMPASLLDSQLKILEQSPDLQVLDISNSPEVLVDEIRARFDF